mmetsp:Transcript_26372/g.76111  ORF Transcript_26372/g.76111 Transcript_26372/m.76111 type:complete len:95 (-) Transcript_26372:1370-1654(-)
MGRSMSKAEVKALFRAARALPSQLRGRIRSSDSSGSHPDFDWLVLVCWNAATSSGLTAASVPFHNGLLESWPHYCAAAAAAAVARMEAAAGSFR